MKKLLLILLLLFTFGASAFANAVVVINDVPSTVVRNQIIAGMASSHGNYVLQEQTENILKFAETKDVNNLLFMGFAKDEVTYTITPNGKNTVVSINENVMIYQRNGMLYSSQVPKNQEYLKRLLGELKAYYNGCYRFGFNLTEKHKDGYKMVIIPNSACDKAGLKTDDVLLSFNSTLTKKIPKKNIQSYEFVDMFNGNPATLVILRDGTKHTYTVTPQFYEPQYKPE